MSSAREASHGDSVFDTEWVLLLTMWTSKSSGSAWGSTPSRLAVASAIWAVQRSPWAAL